MLVTFYVAFGRFFSYYFLNNYKYFEKQKISVHQAIIYLTRW